jgi:Fur family peroxide stress response transcriptional regulator
MRKYKDIGLKLTPQRIAILDYLDGNRQHPTAEEIYRAVSKRFPTMSFATVYNTLETLRRRGSISELTIEQGKKRFDPDPSPHHHLMCMVCKQVHDIGRDFPLPLTEGERRGFDILATHVEFHGICPECRAAGTNARAVAG